MKSFYTVCFFICLLLLSACQRDLPEPEAKIAGTTILSEEKNTGQPRQGNFCNHSIISHYESFRDKI